MYLIMCGGYAPVIVESLYVCWLQTFILWDSANTIYHQYARVLLYQFILVNC